MIMGSSSFPFNLLIVEMYQLPVTHSIVIPALPPRNEYLDFPMEELSYEEGDLSGAYPLKVYNTINIQKKFFYIGFLTS